MVVAEVPVKQKEREHLVSLQETSSNDEGDLVILDKKAKIIDASVDAKKKLVNDSSPEGKQAIADLVEIQQELKFVFSRAVKAVSEVVGMPSDFVRTYFEAKHDKELQIPDNKKIINRIIETLREINRQYSKNKDKKKGKNFVKRYSGEQFKSIEKMYADFLLSNKQNLDRWNFVSSDLLGAIYTETLGILSEINDWEKISDDYCQDPESINLSAEDNKKIDAAIELWRMSFAVGTPPSSYQISSLQAQVGSRLYRLVNQNFKQSWKPKSKQMELDGNSSEEISKEQLKERNLYLLKFPEIAAKFYLNARYESNLTSEKQHEIFEVLSKSKENGLLLAEFNLKGGDLRPEKLTSEERERLFEAYLENAPHKIYWSAEIFHDELNKLSEEKVVSLISSASARVDQAKPFVVAKILSVARLSLEGYSELQKQFPQIGSPSELAKVNPLFAVRNFELCGINKDEEFGVVADLTKTYSPYEKIALMSEVLKYPESYSAETIGMSHDVYFQKIGNILLNKGNKLESALDVFGLAIKNNLLSMPQLDSLRSLLLSDGFPIYQINNLSTSLSESFGYSHRVFNEKEHNQMVAMEFIYGINFDKQNINDINETIKVGVLEHASAINSLNDLLYNVKGKEHTDIIQKIADVATGSQFLDFLGQQNVSSFSEEEKHIIAKRAIFFGNELSLKFFKIDSDFVTINYREDFLQSLKDLTFAYGIIRDDRFSDIERGDLFLRVLKTANRDTNELWLLLNDRNTQDLSEEVKTEAIRTLLSFYPQHIESMCQKHSSIMYKKFLPEIMLHLGAESILKLLDNDYRYDNFDKNQIAEYYLTTISNVDELNYFTELCFPKHNGRSKVNLYDNGIKIFIGKMIELGGESLRLIIRKDQIFNNSTEEQKKLLIERVIESGDVDLIVDIVSSLSLASNDVFGMNIYIKQHPELEVLLSEKIFENQITDKLAKRFFAYENLFLSLKKQQQEQCIQFALESKNIDFVCEAIDSWERHDHSVLDRFPNFKNDLIDHLVELSIEQKNLKLLNNNFSKLSEDQRSVLYDIAIELKDTNILWDVLRKLDWFNFVVPKKVIDYLVENSNSSEVLLLYDRQNQHSQIDSGLIKIPERGFDLSTEQSRLIFEKLVNNGNANQLLTLFSYQSKNLSAQDQSRISEKILENNNVDDVVRIMNSAEMQSLFSLSEQADLVKKHLQTSDAYNKLVLFEAIHRNNLLNEQERNEFAGLFVRDLLLEDERDLTCDSIQGLLDMSLMYSGIIKSEFSQLVSKELEPNIRKRLLSRGSKLGVLSFELLKEEIEKNPAASSELLADMKEIDPSDFWNFAELIKQPGFPPRDAQLFMSLMVSEMLKKGEYAVFDQYDLGESESTRLGKEIKDLVESYKIGDKGKTIIVLLFARELAQTNDLKELASTIKDEIIKYRKVLDTINSAKFPEGVRASIGMEYEVSNSIASAGYVNSTGSNDYKKHILRMSKYASIGQGNDAVHEIATQPTDNPYAMLLEMQLLQDLEFIDFNFEKDGFEKGGRGYHLTIGGERGLQVNESMNVLQNLLVMSGWGGVNAGKNVNILAHGRGVNIRQRGACAGGAIRVFENAASAVEFRSLSLDKKEPFERCVMTSYFGGVAIQTLEKVFPNTPMDLSVMQSVIDGGTFESPEKLYKKLREILVDKRYGETVARLDESSYGETMPTGEPTIQEKEIIFEWLKLVTSVVNQTQNHNNNFYDTEATGYMDEQDNWVGVEEFGGQQNASRFESVVVDNKITLEEYLDNTKIDPNLLFKESSVSLTNSLTAIGNLFLKPSEQIGGDRTNALAMLETTKLGNSLAEEVKGRGLRTSLVDTKGKGREGYYNLQGGSERMLIHAVQKAILVFDARMKEIVFSGNTKKKS